MYVEDQADIGAAVGVAGSFRSVLSTTISTILIAILNNRLATTIPNAVRPAAIDAGLFDDSIPDLLHALEAGTSEAFEAVEGLTTQIKEVAIEAFKDGNMSAYRTVFLVTIAVTVVGTVCAWFMPSVDHLMTDEVAVYLHKTKDEKNLEKNVQGHTGNDTV